MEGSKGYDGFEALAIYAHHTGRTRRCAILAVGPRRFKLRYTSPSSGRVHTFTVRGDAWGVQMISEDMDRLVRYRTAFKSMLSMVGIQDYRPTIFPRDAYDLAMRAEYDRHQRARHDPRRAFPELSRGA